MRAPRPHRGQRAAHHPLPRLLHRLKALELEGERGWDAPLPEDLAAFNVKSRTHHLVRQANVLRTDGSVVSRANREGRFTVDLREYGDIREAFSRILKVLEVADVEP